LSVPFVNFERFTKHRLRIDSRSCQTSGVLRQSRRVSCWTKSISTALGAAVEIKEGKISGDLWFDPALGMIVEANNDQNMTLNVTTRAQTMRTQFSQKIRLALVDVQ